MLCRSVCWLLCLCVAAATPADFSGPHYIAVPEPEVPISRSGTDSLVSEHEVAYSLTETDSLESSGKEQEEVVKQTVAVDLPSLLDAGKGAIVMLVAGDTHLVAHRTVLAARSPVFAAILENVALGSSSTTITITDVEGPVLRQLVAYMYTLQAPQLPDMVPQLLAAADRYGLPELKAVCEEQMAAQLSIETAVATAVLAVKNSYTSLRQAAVAFIKSHIFHVMATQEWTDAMRSQPEALTEVVHLLSDPSTETSALGQTPATAAHSTGLCSNLSADGAAVSLLRSLSQEEKGKMLVAAAKLGAVEHLRLLLAAGADVNVRPGGDNTALQYAAHWGHIEAVKYLLEAGANIEARNGYDNTVLQLAVMFGDPAVVRLLVAHSANLEATNREDWTPLHQAAYFGRPAVVAALVEAGANKKARDDKGRTPLDIAIEANRKLVIDMLK